MPHTFIYLHTYGVGASSQRCGHMAGPIAQPHANPVGQNLPDFLANFSKIDQWIPLRFSGFNRNAPRRGTRIGSALSISADLFSDVIQGNGTGPLLFLTYINELAKILQEYGITIKMFAGDSKMYADITDSADITRLQLSLIHI